MSARPVEPAEIFAIFVAEDGEGEGVRIRKWSTKPFEGGACYRRYSGWPEGHEREAEIRAELARLGERFTPGEISVGDIEALDRVIALHEAMADHGCEGYGDDLWNLRNALVPFPPGHPLAKEDD